MFNMFVPDIYQKSIYDIDYKKLYKNGIKCLIFDLDNTMTPVNIKSPNKKLKDLMEDLKNMKFKLLIVSNATKKRVEPFKDILCIDSSYLSFKPLKRKYVRILKIYKFKENEIACIGDQLLTDILGANRMGFTSILVNPIGKIDFALTKTNRLIENTIFNKLEKRELLKKGKYYE
ncbi:MAG: YqeG family HAD IIIA-type phosphatase [Bacilli bacterium]|nr:YqeG family HAD IIIA-type phosphatase [Bacilli bacterium]